MHELTASEKLHPFFLPKKKAEAKLAPEPARVEVIHLDEETQEKPKKQLTAAEKAPIFRTAQEKAQLRRETMLDNIKKRKEQDLVVEQSMRAGKELNPFLLPRYDMRARLRVLSRAQSDWFKRDAVQSDCC